MPRRASGGDRGLDLLRSETNRSILTALGRGPSSEAELTGWLVLRDRKKLGRHLEALVAAGAVERRQIRRVRRRVEYSLTATGAALVEVIRGVQSWLERHPDRHLEPVSPVGWRAFALLVDAWVSGEAKLLAQAPRSLAELAAAADVSPARASGDLVALQGAGLVITVASEETAGALHALSEWGILGIGVLALGSHWQRAVDERPAPVSVEDAQIALTAALPLARLPESEAGSCALTIEPDEGRAGGRHSAGLRVEVRGGVVSVLPPATGQAPPDAWARGTVGDWLAAGVVGRSSMLRTGGRRELVTRLLAALNAAIFAG